MGRLLTLPVYVIISRKTGTKTSLSQITTMKSLTTSEKLSLDKHSSLLRTFINYGRKKFYNIGPRGLHYKKLRICIRYDKYMIWYMISYCTFSKPVEVTANNNTYWRICQFTINYEFIMFYSIGPWGVYYKTLLKCNVRSP